MCGINGIVCISESASAVDDASLRRTRDYMAHRGPDGSGEWISPDGRVGLGHRRLSIIDLSDGGAQPMSWQDGRYQIVFNGEIYNYAALQCCLEREGLKFQSNSDTEVLLAMYAHYGAGMLLELRGMFAFAIWDQSENTLFLARDPYGIKPLYYTVSNGHLYFASQVKALLVNPVISAEVDPAGLVGFMLWGAVPEPHTIRQQIKALPAGHSLVIHAGRPVGEPASYYSFDAASHTSVVSLKEAVEQTVAAHLIADVPVAVFLSSGLDSALIAALARRLQPAPPTTITIVFDGIVGTPSDEGPLAAQIAGHLGTHHIERRVGRNEFVDLWDRAVTAMDQPSIDGFNTFLISRIAHEAGFKVVLSGIGGDELWGSYPSFRDVPKMHRLARVSKGVPGISWLFQLAGNKLGRPKLSGMATFGDTMEGAFFLYRGLYLPDELPSILGHEVAAAGLAVYNPITSLRRQTYNLDQHDVWQQIHRFESSQYMSNQLLRDADWSSMAHSLELRVPLADTVLRNQMAALNFEPARSSGKAAVVQHIAPELPKEVFTRPKTGFSIPVMDWLRSPGQETGATRQGMNSRILALKVLEASGLLFAQT